MKINNELIQSEVSKVNWTLSDSVTYKNLDTQLEFICPNNHTVYQNWRTVRKWLEKGECKCPTCIEDQKLQRKQEAEKAISSEHIPLKKSKRVLGLDQATHVTGYCIIEGGTILKIGTFKTNSNLDEIQRSNQIKYWMLSLIVNWKIDYVVIEGVQLEHNNPQTLITLARLQGILMSSLTKHNIKYNVAAVATWREYNKVKGATRSDRKVYMQNLIKDQYSIMLTDDECDAVGIARYGYSQLAQLLEPMEEW